MSCMRVVCSGVIRSGLFWGLAMFLCETPSLNTRSCEAVCFKDDAWFCGVTLHDVTPHDFVMRVCHAVWSCMGLRLFCFCRMVVFLSGLGGPVFGSVRGGFCDQV